MKSTVVDESLSSYKPMYCSREYQTSTRLNQQYEKSTLNKIDRLMVMMDKLVTEDNRCSKPFKPQVYQPGRSRSQNRGNFCSRFRNNAYRGHALYNQILEVDIGMTLLTEEILVIILEVVRGTGIIIMIIGETILEVKVMIGIEVDH